MNEPQLDYKYQVTIFEVCYLCLVSAGLESHLGVLFPHVSDER